MGQINLKGHKTQIKNLEKKTVVHILTVSILSLQLSINLIFTAKEEEKRAVGVAPKPATVTQPQAKRKDDAYDQFMKEMENLL